MATMKRPFLTFLASATLLERISHAFKPSIAGSRCQTDRQLFEDTSLFAITVGTPETNTNKRASVWFPTRIQDTLDYDTVIQRLYLRHIVTETEAMAVEALQLSTRFAQRDTTSADPFGQAAASISACTATRDEGGTIGWVERHDQLIPSSILSETVIQDLYQLQPKAGDVLILADDANQRWHVIQVSEIWMNQNAFLQSSPRSTQLIKDGEPLVGSFAGSNVVVPRRKLKGLGVLPEFPELKSYHIQTAGCQMNVADSERLAGILQNDLKLTVAESPANADLVLFNTCSIRDHAEQKLYDALGPYAAAKRKGKRLALIVTGCVAQQEGEALLKRVPEIDVVLGPQYVPHLKNVLEQVAAGQQLVATAPMLLQEQNDNTGLHSKPVRGHDVRAWVNVIHGCNEHCTYCVVPGTRGMEQSRTMEAVLQECLDLAATGYKEVTLLGQNIDAYGRDMVPKRTFAELLEFLNTNLPDKMRIRYVRC
jgi:Uncharacterized protein family UPF0004/Radical SAM superfamily